MSSSFPRPVSAFADGVQSGTTHQKKSACVGPEGLGSGIMLSYTVAHEVSALLSKRRDDASSGNKSRRKVDFLPKIEMEPLKFAVRAMQQRCDNVYRSTMKTFDDLLHAERSIPNYTTLCCVKSCFDSKYCRLTSKIFEVARKFRCRYQPSQPIVAGRRAATRLLP